MQILEAAKVQNACLLLEPEDLSICQTTLTSYEFFVNLAVYEQSQNPTSKFLLASTSFWQGFLLILKLRVNFSYLQHPCQKFITV